MRRHVGWPEGRGPVLVLSALFLTGCAGLGHRTGQPPPARVVSAPPAATVPGPSSAPTNPPSIRAQPPPPVTPPPAPLPAPAPAAKAEPGLGFRTVLAVQTLIDREHFSANAADGAFGPRTRSALQAWQESHGLETTGLLDALTREELGDLENAFALHVITEEERAALTPVPETWRGKSQVDRLGYETILEYLAETCHVTEAALQRLNPDAAWPDPPVGTELEVPDPESRRPPKAARVTISLRAKLVRAYDADGALIAHFPCSIAQQESKRPVGELHVSNVAKDPDYTFDPAVFPESPEAQQIRGKLLLPPGPNNPVGVAWIGLDRPGYGIHGTPHPEDIGKTESHGCFRLANWNAAKLLRMIELGTPVIVEP